MAQRTRSRVSAVTWGSSLKTRDTVFALTPATRATSRMVVTKDRLQIGRPLRPRELARQIRATPLRWRRVPRLGAPGDQSLGDNTSEVLTRRLVDRCLAGCRAQVGTRDDGELGADLRGGGLALQRRDRLVDRVGPDHVRR